ncbi:MAG: ChbG/HpnK family deacetylase [Cyanobacteria bacterium SIG30]|nr:ChbG/HpnK family deacetylase [Cyanobacteria bacterium SIG30]
MNTSKKIIMTADDFGMTSTRDNAIMDCFLNGFLTSTCICANGKTFENAMNQILPKCIKLGKRIDLGVHLDLIEGHALTECPLLTYESGMFKHGFISLLINSFNFDFLKEVENELRAQTEKVVKEAEKQNIKVSFINSHIHFHAIPNIFKIVKKIAEEYDIPFVRTQKELPALLGGIKLINFIKVVVLWFLNLFNKADFTNDYIMGVAHTAHMNKDEIFFGVERLANKNCLIEILLHPDSDIKNASGYFEYQTMLDDDLRKNIEELGFKFTSILDLKN